MTIANPERPDFGPNKPIPQIMCARISHFMSTKNPRDRELARSIALEWGIEWKD